MFDLLGAISALNQHMNFILLIGIAILGGTIGGRIVRRLRIPQIIGYIAIGIVLGPILNIISQQTVQTLEPFNLFALGLIGFLVGGELKRAIFVKFGKQVPLILLFEGVAAFALVTILSFLVMWYFADIKTAVTVALVFGAICSATDPTSTIAVLWEYKARGPLTSMLTAIVTLDDALALFLYVVSVSAAGIITGHADTGFLAAMWEAFYEIAGSLAMGAVTGALLSWVLRQTDDDKITLVITLSLLSICIGAAILLHLDVILSAMAAGVVITNCRSKKSSVALDVLHKDFASPIYVLFFVLVGARVNFSHVDKMILMLVAAYVCGSVVGKTLGSYLGGLYSGAVKTVRNYLGFCLYPQGGIAIGLLIMASSRFESDVSSIMLLVVIIGAFVLQIIGPIGVKLGALKAGELGLNVTEEDLIKGYKVGDVMETNVPAILAGTPLSDVLQVVSNTEHFYYSIVDDQKKVIGALTLDGIRNTFATQEINDWLVALDISEPVIAKVTPDVLLSAAFEQMQEHHIEHVPVVLSEQNNESVGILGTRAVHRQLSAEVLEKQQEADRMYAARPK